MVVLLPPDKGAEPAATITAAPAATSSIVVSRPNSNLKKTFECDGAVALGRGNDGGDSGGAVAEGIAALAAIVAPKVESAVKAGESLVCWSFSSHTCEPARKAMMQGGASGDGDDDGDDITSTNTANSTSTTNTTNNGVILAAARAAFEAAAACAGNDVRQQVVVSAVHVSTETDRCVIDGLTGSAALKIRDSPRVGFHFDGNSAVVVESVGELEQWVRLGLRHPKAASPAERHHTVVTVQIKRLAPSGDCTYSYIHLADFASGGGMGGGGGEGAKGKGQGQGKGKPRGKKPGADDKTLKGIFRVIDALAAGGSHVPYRDTKLTRWLKPGFGGHARSLMLLVADAGQQHHSETEAYLSLASKKVRAIQQNVQPLTMNVDNEVEVAAAAISALCEGLGMAEPPPNANAVRLNMDSPPELVALRDTLAARDDAQRDRWAEAEILSDQTKATVRDS